MLCSLLLGFCPDKTTVISGVAPSIWKAQNPLPNAYSEVASLSIEYALPSQTTLNGEYQFVHGVHLGRTTNTNLAAPVVLTTANASMLDVSNPTAQQLGQLVFSPTRLNPAYDAINQFATSADSKYNGGTVTLNRQFQDDLQLLVGYSYSKTLDDASSDWERPQNPYALANERTLSLEDQRQRLTLSGLWLIGPDLGRHGKPKYRLSTLPTALGIPSGFPHSRRFDDRTDISEQVQRQQISSRFHERKGLVKNVSGPQRNACPGTLTP